MQISRIQAYSFNYLKETNLKSNNINHSNVSSRNYCELPICPPDKMLVTFKGKDLTDKIYDELHRNLTSAREFVDVAVKYNKKCHDELISALTKRDDNSTLMYDAVQIMNKKEFGKLLDVFKDFDEFKKVFSSKDRTQDTPFNFLLTFAKNRDKIFRQIVQKYGPNEGFKDMLTASDISSWTPLHGLMCEISYDPNHDAKTNPDAIDCLLTIFEGDPEGLEKALKIKDDRGKTPLDKLKYSERLSKEGRKAVHDKLTQAYKQGKKLKKDILNNLNSLYITPGSYPVHCYAPTITGPRATDDEAFNALLSNTIKHYKEKSKTFVSVLTQKDGNDTPLHPIMARVNSDTFSELLSMFNGNKKEIQNAFNIKNSNDKTPFDMLEKNPCADEIRAQLKEFMQ